MATHEGSQHQPPDKTDDNHDTTRTDTVMNMILYGAGDTEGEKALNLEPGCSSKFQRGSGVDLYYYYEAVVYETCKRICWP
jgi:hypothetical protein